MISVKYNDHSEFDSTDYWDLNSICEISVGIRWVWKCDSLFDDILYRVCVVIVVKVHLQSSPMSKLFARVIELRNLSFILNQIPVILTILSPNLVYL